MEGVVFDRWLLDKITMYSGGVMWLQGFRGTCRAARRLIPPPWRFADDEQMLEIGASQGDVGLCEYAMHVGACNYLDMLKTAARHGKYRTYKLAYDTMGRRGPHWDESCDFRWPLLTEAVQGGNETIIDHIIGPCITAYGSIYNYTVEMIWEAWRTLHMDIAMKVLDKLVVWHGNDVAYLYLHRHDVVKYFMAMYGYTGDSKYRNYLVKYGVCATTSDACIGYIEGVVRSGNSQRITSTLAQMISTMGSFYFYHFMDSCAAWGTAAVCGLLLNSRPAEKIDGVENTALRAVQFGHYDVAAMILSSYSFEDVPLLVMACGETEFFCPEFVANYTRSRKRSMVALIDSAVFNMHLEPLVYALEHGARASECSFTRCFTAGCLRMCAAMVESQPAVPGKSRLCTSLRMRPDDVRRLVSELKGDESRLYYFKAGPDFERKAFSLLDSWAAPASADAQINC